MKLLYYFCFGLFVYILLSVSIQCASISLPLGGPKDSLPPILIRSNPPDSQIYFKNKKITFYFNEFLQENNLINNLFISPNPTLQPEIKIKLNTVTIFIKDTLKPNTTYSYLFNNAIADLREKNLYKKLSYCFSTGDMIDHNTFQGSVVNAETGEFDSTVIVILYRYTKDDSIVFHERPDYFSPVNSQGRFSFSFLPADSFLAFVVQNSNKKNYFDSTTPFAFLNHPIITSTDTNKKDTFYFYKSIKNNNKKANSKIKNIKEKDIPKISFKTPIENNEYDFLKPFSISFVNKVFWNDSFNIQLTDTFYKPYSNFMMNFDTTNFTFKVNNFNWLIDKPYYLIMPSRLVKDEYDKYLANADTIKFKTFNDKNYGKLILRLKNIDLTQNYILQCLVNKEVILKMPITKNTLTIPYMYPGKLNLSIYKDENKNGIWDKGFYSKQLKYQPEKAIIYPKDLQIKKNWDNEFVIEF